MNTADLDLRLTRTACKVAANKGWEPEQIKDNFYHPAAVVESDTHPGQYKVVSKDMTIIGVNKGDGTFLGITMKKST